MAGPTSAAIAAGHVTAAKELANGSGGNIAAKMEARMKRITVALVLASLVVVLLGCAPGVNELAGTAGGQGVVAGFWRGLWNGLIAPITLIISLFNRSVQMYEVHNNGGWYNFGFLLGLSIIFGGGGRGAARRRRQE